MRGGRPSSISAAAIVAIVISCGACGGGSSTPKAGGTQASQPASTTPTTGLHQKAAIQFPDPPVTAAPSSIMMWIGNTVQDMNNVVQSMSQVDDDIKAQDVSSIVGACASLHRDVVQMAKDSPSPDAVLNADIRTTLSDLESVTNLCVTGDMRGFLTGYAAARTEFSEVAHREKTLLQAPVSG